MAVTLEVQLTDTEQSRILEIAAVVAPGATPLEIKAWAETVCKNALRAEVSRYALEAFQQLENTRRLDMYADLAADWPEPEIVLPVVEPIVP